MEKTYLIFIQIMSIKPEDDNFLRINNEHTSQTIIG